MTSEIAVKLQTGHTKMHRSGNERPVGVIQRRRLSR